MKTKLTLFIWLFLCTSTFIYAQFNSGTFSTKLDFVSGSSTSNPQGIVCSDIDGDNKPDIVISNSSNSTISIFRNTSTPGNVSFAPQVVFASPSASSWLNMGDIDGDGKMDIVIAVSSGSQFSIYRNTSTIGNITLAPRQDVTANNTPGFIGLGDLDGDSKLDIVATNYNSNNISVFRNTSTTGSISLASKFDVTVGNSPAFAVIYDMDGDAKNDIAISNYNGTSISIIKNNSTSIGSITLALNTTLTTPTLPGYLKSADLDGDGKLDLIVANYISNNISVFRNASTTPGIITFNPRVDFASGTGTSAPQGIAIVDINNDSKLDIAVANRLNNSISTFMNLSSPGSFSTTSLSSRFQYATGIWPTDIFAADIDGDFRPDLVAANNGTNTFSFLRNQFIFIQPTLPTANLIFSNIQPTSINVAFSKGNGSRRIVLCRQSSAVNAIPVDSTLYSASNRFGLGTQIGSGNFVIYNDTGSFFTLNGLTPNTNYHFAVFEYNGIGGYANFLPTALTGNQNTTNFTLLPLPDRFICKGDSVMLLATGGSAYSWSPAVGLSSTTIANPIAKPETTTTYVLAITTVAGILFDTVVVQVNQNCCINADANNSSLIFAAPIAGNVFDVSPDPLIPILSGDTAALATDRFGNNNGAYNFTNVASDKITYPASTKLSFNQNQSFTISAWTRVRSIRPNPNYILTIFQNGGFDTYIGGTAGATPNKLCFVDFNGPSMSVRSLVTSPANFPLNTWNLVTVTVDKVDSTNTLYLNGVKIAQVKANNSVMTNCGIVLGNHTVNPWGLDGWIDDARIYSKALDSLEVKSLFDNRRVVILNNDTTIRVGDSLVIRTFNSASSYSWTPTIGVSNPSIANPVLKPTQSTSYVLSAISASGCIMMDTIVVNVDSTINNINEKQDPLSIIIYPNPAKRMLNIDHANYPSMTVRILNLLGQTILETNVNETYSTLELPNIITPGAYFFQCFQPLTQELILVKKLIIE